MARKRKRPGDPLRAQVQAETDLRYGASFADLGDARRQNYRQYKNTVNTAEESAAAIKQAANDSIGQLKQIYDQADETRNQAAAQIQQAVNVAKAPGSALAFAIQAERAGATRDFAQERAGAQGEAVARGRDAAAGLVYQKSNAVEDFRANRADIQAKQRQLKSEAGQFAVQRLGELQDAQQKAQDDERDRIIAETGYDPITQQYTLTGRKGIADLTGVDPVTGKAPRGTKTLSAAERRQRGADTAQASDQITLARTWLQRLTQGNSVQQAMDLLRTGGSIPHSEDFTGRNAQGQPVKKSRQVNITVPAIGTDYLQAALELEQFGHLTKGTVHKLRTTRNVHIPKEWLPSSKSPRPTGVRNNAATQLSNSVLQAAKGFGQGLKVRSR